MAEPTGSKQKGPGKRYIEIVNWRKAQPRMAEGQNFWCKLYTDLLDNDSYHEFSNESRVLVTAIWMYAARTGKHVFPSDPKWLHKRIPMLYEEPDFEPLLNARNIYGEPTPFIRYCDAQASQDGQGREFEGGQDKEEGRGKRGPRRKSGAKTGHPGGPSKERPSRQKQKTHSREEKRTETLHPADSGFGERKEREILTDFSRKGQSTPQHSSAEQIAATAQQSSPEPAKPANPMESEAGGAPGRIVPLPPPSARGLGQHRVEQIIVEHIPAHWLDEDAEEFGWQIVRALGLSAERGGREARSDWGAFASWWCKVKGNASPMLLAELRTIAIAKAVYLFRKGRSARKKQAVWFSIMQAELLHHGITLPPARASPQAKAQV